MGVSGFRKSRKYRGGGGWGGGKITDASVENVGNRQMSLVSEVNTNDCNRTQRPRKAIMDKFDRT